MLRSLVGSEVCRRDRLSTGMLRIHKLMQLLMLQVRSAISGMQRLMTTTKEERQLKRARNKLKSLGRKKPQHITGRQFYVMELNSTDEQFRSQGPSPIHH